MKAEILTSSKKARKALVRKRMTLILTEMPKIKLKFISNSKYANRTKVQGFNASRDLNLCYKTHMNRSGRGKTADYVEMSLVMANIAEWYEANEPVNVKLLHELNSIRIVLRYSQEKFDIKKGCLMASNIEKN